MAWPKGKPRKPVTTQHVPLAEIAKPEPAPDPAKSSSYHRAITAYRVRRIPIPRELRVHDYMPLARIATKIREEMAAVGAPDSEVEAFVARHVPAD